MAPVSLDFLFYLAFWSSDKLIESVKIVAFVGWLSLLGKSPEESLCDWFCFRGAVEAGLVRLGSSGSVHIVTQRRPVLFSLPRTFLRVGFLFSRCEKLSNEE